MTSLADIAARLKHYWVPSTLGAAVLLILIWLAAMNGGYYQLVYDGVTDYTADWISLFPLVLAVAVCWLCLGLVKTQTRLITHLAISSCLIVYTSYIVYRIVVTPNLATAQSILASLLLLAIELGNYVYSIAVLALYLNQTDRSAEANRLEPEVRSGRYRPTVDVFIPTYSESVDMLKRTVAGCQALDYPEKKIYLLDDNHRRDIRLLAEELGCEYVARDTHEHAKAGNINHALKITRGELVLVFDADFVPCTNFLTRVVGFFREQDVGMVVTPQYFYNEEAGVRNLGLGRELPPEQTAFFRKTQPSRDSYNAVICHGTCFVARRKSLERIGGISTDTVCEDWGTSLLMLARKEKIYYLNEPLSWGAAAENMVEYISQRVRWGQGVVQTLFSQYCPLHLRGLDFKQRIVNLLSIVYYLQFPFKLLLLILPIVFLLIGIDPFKIYSGNQIYFFLLPVFVINITLSSWICRGHASFFLNYVNELMIVFPLSVNVIRTIINPWGRGFRVTKKGLTRSRVQANWRYMLPLAVVLALYLTELIWVIAFTGDISAECLLISYLWSAMCIIGTWVAMLALIDVREERALYRLPVYLRTVVRTPHGDCRGTARDMTEAGVLLELEGEGNAEDLRRAKTVWLDVPEAGIVKLPAEVAWRAGNKLALKYAGVPLPAYRKLVETLYCRPGPLPAREINEGIAMKAYLKTAVTIPPLMDARKCGNQNAEGE